MFRVRGLAIAVQDDRNGGQGSVVNGLFLLFAAGKRPDIAALREFTDEQPHVALSYDPSSASHLSVVGKSGEGSSGGPDGEHRWAELLSRGLTFDLRGLLPEIPVALPGYDQAFDFEEQPENLDLETLWLLPGKHLAGGERSMPVVRGLVGLCRDMTRHFGELRAVVWPAARTLIGRRFFESTVTAWLEGGAFPALGLTAFRQMPDGALQTNGLSFFIGQELRIEPVLADDRVAATRLGIRLVNHLVLMNGIKGEERIAAPDGRNLVLAPSLNREIVRVWAE